jgi:hypothetical protein
MLNQQTIQKLVANINKDSHLSTEEKLAVVSKLADPTFIDSGSKAPGVIKKFLNLPIHAQILLTVAGFGIAKYLLDKSKKHDKFIEYNEKLKTYEINA